MNKWLIVLVPLAAAPASAKAQNLAEIAQFAQSICGDIPEGSLTRTSVQGKVEINATALAKIITGSGNVSASKAEEIYRGVPFDKLPDSIPTVAMCKSELAKILIMKAQKESYVSPNSVGEVKKLCTSSEGTEIQDTGDFYAPAGMYFTEVSADEVTQTVNFGDTPLVGCHITDRYYPNNDQSTGKTIGVRVYAHADCSSNFAAVASRWTITAQCRVSGKLAPL